MLALETGQITRLGLAGVSPHYVSTGHLVYAVEDGSVRAVPFDAASLEAIGNSVPLVEGVIVKASGAANFGISDTGRIERRIARLMLGLPETAVQDRELDAAAMNVYVGDYQLGPLVLRVYQDGQLTRSAIWSLCVADGPVCP